MNLTLKIDWVAFFDKCAANIAERVGTPYKFDVTFSRSFSGIWMPIYMGDRLDAFARVLKSDMELSGRLYFAVMVEGRNVLDVTPERFWRE